MTGYSKRFLALLLIGLSAFEVHSGPCDDACWEPCFQTEGTENERFKEVYDELLETALEITYLKNVYNVSKIAYLIDSALSSRHNVPENPDAEKLESGVRIYQFEILLAMALSLTVNQPTNYLVQYDEEAAWTCDEFSCLPDACTTVAGINQQTPVQMTPTSHCVGNIEAACRLAQKQILEVACPTAVEGRTMVVAITNGNFHINGHSGSHHDSDEHHLCPPLRWGHDSSSSSSSEEFFSPCKSYFDNRYVIGTHDSSKELMGEFNSKHGNYRYFHAEQFSYDALLSIVNCMLDATKCCAAPPPAITPVANCKKTQGPFGESVNPFVGHPATDPAYGVFAPATVPIVP